jgi:hypothetical protein
LLKDSLCQSKANDPTRWKGAKKRLPKLPRVPVAADLQEQSSIYLRERNEMMRLKRMCEEMLLAKERDQLCRAIILPRYKSEANPASKLTGSRAKG